MLAAIDDCLVNIRHRLHSRAVAVTAQGYIHTAVTSWVSYSPDPFTYYVNNQVYEGRIHQYNGCTTMYLLETPDVIWELPLPYKGSYMYDEFMLTVPNFRDFVNLIVIGDTVEIVTNERNYIDFECVLLYPSSLSNTSVNQSIAVIECTHQIIELLRLNHIQVNSLTEYTRFDAKIHDLLGEFVLYRIQCKLYNN